MARWPRVWRPARPVARAAALGAVLVAGAGARPAAADFATSVDGGPMSVATATLAAPGGLSASRSCTSATTLGTDLSWSASTSAATTGYSILRSTASAGPFSAVGAVSGISTTTYTDSISPPAAADDLYVAVKSPNGMDVVSLSSGAKTASSGGPSLNNPTAIAVTPDGTTAYLANSGANTVTPVDLATDAAGPPINVGPKPPTGLAVTSNGSTVWVADGTGNVVTPITVASGAAGAGINVGFNATAIAITPSGTTAWIVGQNNAVPLNLSTGSLGTRLSQGGANFQAIAIAPDGTTAYALDAGGKKLWPIDLSTGTWGSAIGPLSFAPAAIAISPGGTTAWVAGQADIVPVSLSGPSVGSVLSVGGANFSGIAVAPNGCWVYAADSSKNNQIVPVSTTTDTQATPIPTDPSPMAIATAYPWADYYYQVRATRDQWTSPSSSSASMAFGQPPLSSAPAAPTITSPAGVAFSAGVADAFSVTATGGPTPSLSESGSLPSGVGFVDNGNGTATLSGTPTGTGSYPLTITATNSQGSASQAFSLNVYSSTLVASGNATVGLSVTSTSLTLQAGSAYLVLAMTHDAVAGPNVLAVAGAGFSTLPSFTQVGTQVDYDSDGAHAGAWYLTGGSGSGTVALTLTNPTQDAYLEVVQIQGADAASPVVTATEGSANSGTTAGTSASADLSGAPSAGDYEVVFQDNVGDAGPPAPTSSSFGLVPSSYLHGGGPNGASVAALGGAATQTAALSLGSSVVWATTDLEIAPA